MTEIGYLIKIFAMAVIVLSVSGCISERPVPVESMKDVVASSSVVKGAPDWVNSGSRLHDGKGMRLFHGVGYAAPMGDMALQKSVADDNARAEAAIILTAFVDKLYANYVAFGRAGEKNFTVKDESVMRQLENISSANLNVVRISGGWRDLNTYNVWSIAELDMKQLKGALAGLGSVDAEFRFYIEQNADSIFDRIISERNLSETKTGR